MTRRSALGILFVAGGMNATTRLENSAIDDFDRVIQKRFAGIGRFGMSRIAVLGPHGLLSFQPMNREETAAVNALPSPTALYIAGRDVLDGKQEPLASFRGPVAIHPRAAISGLPTQSDLQSGAARALAAFQKQDRYVFVTSGWTVEGRPIRATQESCVQCHSAREPKRAAPHLQDALGVVLYLYR